VHEVENRTKQNPQTVNLPVKRIYMENCNTSCPLYIGKEKVAVGTTSGKTGIRSGLRFLGSLAET